jgi:molybdopterin molybdotransferase
VRDSNGSILKAKVEQVGAISCDYGIVRDTKEQISAAVRKAAEENDIILISGGVSAGDYDYVPPVLKDASFNLFFEKIAVKPGKPTVFGVRNHTYCFGLPGYPFLTSQPILSILTFPVIQVE